MSGFSLKLRLAAAGLGAALLSGGCGLMAPAGERYVAPPSGATWMSERRDTGSYGAGSARVPGKRSERVWQGNQVITFEAAGGTIFATPSGNWIGMFKGDTPLITWDPPLAWDWPLEVGKTWTREQRMTIHAAKRTIAYVVTQKVEAYEDVTVPAGTFKTFRVSTSTSLGDENMVWFSPELGIFVKQSLRRTARHAAGAGTREIDVVSQNIKK